MTDRLELSFALRYDIEDRKVKNAVPSPADGAVSTRINYCGNSSREVAHSMGHHSAVRLGTRLSSTLILVLSALEWLIEAKNSTRFSRKSA